MKTSKSDFDLIITEKHCDIVADDMAMLLPLTMTLEECIEICCEKNNIEFIKIIKIYSKDSNGNCEGEFSYGY